MQGQYCQLHFNDQITDCAVNLLTQQNAFFTIFQLLKILHLHSRFLFLVGLEMTLDQLLLFQMCI